MTKPRISPAFAARLLAARLRADEERPVLQLELPPPDRRGHELSKLQPDDDPDALVLEADGSFTDVRGWSS